MKKMTAFMFLVVFVMLISCGCEKGQAWQSEGTVGHSAETAESSSAAVSETGGSSAQIEYPQELLTDKYMREIDGAYAEEAKLPDSGTTAGMVQLANKYADQWAAVADEYYQKIMEYDGIIEPSEAYYSADDLHTFVSNMKTNWDQYYQVHLENYVDTLKCIYGTGTIVGPVAASQRYSMQRDWALLILEICDLLGIR